MQALARRDPRNPVLERAVRWLMLNRTRRLLGHDQADGDGDLRAAGFMQARGETAQPFAVDVFVNGELAGQPAFTAAR